LKDATFKRLVKNPTVRNSFLRVFLDIPVKRSDLNDSNLKDDASSAVKKIFNENMFNNVEKEMNLLKNNHKNLQTSFK